MSASGYVHVHVDRVVRETNAALLLEVDGVSEWVPKSQLADPDTYEAGDTNLTVSMTEFIAREKGFEGED
jgi:hypothetical protein